MTENIKVRLKTDLTRYNPKLVIGVEGVTVGQTGMWSRGSDRFIGVNFPEIGTFDILWEGLEIIDQEYLAKMKKQKDEEAEALKTATDVVKYVGPNGGFQCLRYTYTGPDGRICSTSQGFRAKAEEIESLLRAYNIPIREVREQRRQRK